MLDVSRQTVSRWESGKSIPSSVQLSNLCKAFNIDANNLFDPDAELTADSAVRQPDGVNVEGAKRNIALPLTVGVLLLAAFAGLIVTIIYAERTPHTTRARRYGLGGSRSRQHPDEQSIYAFFAGVYVKRSAES